MKRETLIYAIPKDQPITARYTEQLMYAGGRLLTQLEIDKIMAAASADGWHSFRFTAYDCEPPVFGANLLAR